MDNGERVQVKFVKPYESFSEGREYLLPEELAEALVEKGVAVVLIIPAETETRPREIGPKEYKPAGPKEFKAAEEEKIEEENEPEPIVSTPALVKPEIAKPKPVHTPPAKKKATPKKRH